MVAEIFEFRTAQSARNASPYLVVGNAARRRSSVMATDDELMDAKLRTVSAETDTKIARLEGKIDTAVATLIGEMRAIRDDVKQADQYNRDSRLFILGAILAAVLALGGMAIGMATYGDALFGRGMNVRDVIQSTIKDYDLQRQQQPNASRLR